VRHRPRRPSSETTGSMPAPVERVVGDMLAHATGDTA